MCGIFCSACNDNKSQSIDVQLCKLLQNRGPNSHNFFEKKNLLFGGCVLWQQGQSITPQPLCLKNWTLLLNGDIFSRNTNDGSSDTSWLIQKLSNCTDDNEILMLFKSLKGPYSVIMFDDNTDQLYFARDSLGRNSLIIERDTNGLTILSNSFISETKSEKLSMELPPHGLYKVNVKDLERLFVYPWVSKENNFSDGLEELRELLPVIAGNESISPIWLLSSNYKKESFDFYHICSSRTADENVYDYLLRHKNVNNSVTEFLQILRNSVKERVKCTTKYCSTCITDMKPKCDHPKIGILFSGGIDCTILATIANEFVDISECIELINVAFEAPNAKQVNWDVPDRCSAKESYEELTRICPTRNWKFVEVNVTRSELNDKLQSHIKHLIYPLNTVLDESLGCAFWFASRGIGHCNGEPYKSTSRVILIGSGADELFGGYTRHRNAFTRCNGTHEDKIASLSAELEIDWQRIPARNLGRDDRVIADNGKTSRAPFIQEDLVNFVRNLKPEQRCCFTLDQGVGDKLFLRLAGYKLSLRSSVLLKKRAIQFGSRIANKNQNAKDISVNIQ